jgi:prepilin-type N-terminal cleavage/methylation domain-containing protein
LGQAPPIHFSQVRTSFPGLQKDRGQTASNRARARHGFDSNSKQDHHVCRTSRALTRTQKGKQVMKNHRGFTIIELLVVVSIIALLVGILLPAIGKAREQAQLTKSQANLKQIGTAHVSYAAEYADRQVTWCFDNLSQYGGAAQFNGMTGAHASVPGLFHPLLVLGYGQGGIWHLILQAESIQPYVWGSNFGTFRICNASALSRYLNGRFYDPIFYAPKDTAVLASVEKWFDHPNEYVENALTGGQKWPSYIMSPAGMFNPAVFMKNTTTNKYYTDPLSLPTAFKSPGMSSATYPDLKTHMIEHHWLQNRKRPCNPAFTGGVYDGCTPYFFNASQESNAVALFYDSHIGSVGAETAQHDCQRVQAQNGPANAGLWSIDQPNGGGYIDNSVGGYYMAQALDWTSTSHTIFTIDGIKGRDLLPH